jgi:hypothetical protein
MNKLRRKQKGTRRRRSRKSRCLNYSQRLQMLGAINSHEVNRESLLALLFIKITLMVLPLLSLALYPLLAGQFGAETEQFQLPVIMKIIISATAAVVAAATMSRLCTGEKRVVMYNCLNTLSAR